MTERSATHATFTIERRYPAAPARVFNAFADREAKKRWFSGPDEWSQGKAALDFRVDGRETSSGGPKDGPVYTFNAIYQDIVENERIIYSYEMLIDGKRMSVSLATIELARDGNDTLLVFTEQGVFLDGLDTVAFREQGTRDLLDGLGKFLAGQS